MSKLKKINIYRRKIMKSLTQHIGVNKSLEHYKTIKPELITKVLVCRPNQRLGNLILITPLIQEIESFFPNAKVDVIVKGTLAPILFKNYHSVDKIIELPKKPFKNIFLYINTWLSVKFKRYDLVINPVVGSSSGKLLTAFSRSKYKIYGDIELNIENSVDNYFHMAKKPVYQLRGLLQFNNNTINVNKEVSTLSLKLSEAELQHGKHILNDLVKNSKPTIAIFTFATGLKCHSKSWWLAFYEGLKTKFPNHNLIEVLPFENVSQIDFKETSYYSKDLREICAVIANTTVFIGADSGMMHLANASGTKTIGLFSVTYPEKFQPYGNGSFSIFTPSYTVEENLDLIHIP